MSTLTVRLLGGLRLEHDGVVVHLASARARAIVAYLLLHRDCPHERAELASVLWPDSGESQARTNLRQALHQLRRTLPDVDRFFVLDGQRLQARSAAPLELDVARFEECTAHTRQMEDAVEAGPERERLEEAVRYYRGDLLPEMYEEWLDAPRERQRERYVGVLERLVAITEEQRDYRAALRHAQRWLQHDPLVEEPYRRLMRLYALCGERAKALHAYHSCASLLQREVGGEPTRQTQMAYEKLLRLDSDDAACAAAAADDAVQSAAASAVPLVGRRHELAQLRTAWQQVNAGGPSLVLVSGESGIGKSRLVEEFVRGLSRREASVVTARCYAAEGALAFAPVTSLLRGAALAAPLADLDPAWRRELSRLLPELADQRSARPAPLEEYWQRRRLLEAMARVVLAGQPVVLVFDDLQWCDRDTLEWLRFLLRFDARARVLVVAAVRSHEVDANTALVGLLAELWVDGSISECELGPLDEVETAALARSLWRGEPTAEALARLFEQTEGVPLFVVEMLHSGWDTQVEPPASSAETPPKPLPPKLRAVIAARLRQLSPTSAELMSMAAVIGREFGFEVLVKVSRRSEDEVMRGLDELWQRRIVREVAAGLYDFSHDKLREVAYAAMSQTRRQQLHRYTAEALETLAEADDVSGQIAYHYDLAESPERAIPHYRLAAEAARALFAQEEAVAAYERALELIEGLRESAAFARWRDEVVGQLLEGLGDVRHLQGLHEVAREHFGAALERLLPAARVDRARRWRKIGETLVSQHRYDEAFAALASAEDALGPQSAGAGSAWWREWIDIGLARSFAHVWRGEWDATGRVLSSLEVPLRRHGTAVERGRLLVLQAFAVLGRDGHVHSDEAVGLLRAAMAEAEEADSESVGTAARFLLGFALLWHDDRGEVRAELEAEAQTQLEHALAACEASGDAVMRVSCLTSLSFVHRMAGNFDATRAYALRTLEAATALEMPQYVGAAHGQLAWLAWRAEDHGTCEREGEAALAWWRSGWPYPLQWNARLPLMAVRMRQGRLEAALACVAPLLEPNRQRLPELLTESLEAAAQADAGPEAREAALERVLVVAQATRRL